MSEKYYPGNKVPGSGPYNILDPNGNPTSKNVNCQKGKKFPPTPKKDEAFTPGTGNKRNHHK